MEHSRQFSEFSKVQKNFQQLLSNVSAVIKTQFSNESIILQHNFSNSSVLFQQYCNKFSVKLQHLLRKFSAILQNLISGYSSLFQHYSITSVIYQKWKVQMNRIFKQIKFIHIFLNIHFSHITYLPLPETSLNALLLVQFDFLPSFIIIILGTVFAGLSFPIFSAYDQQLWVVQKQFIYNVKFLCIINYMRLQLGIFH